VRREHEDEPPHGPDIDPVEHQRQLHKARQARIAKFLVVLFLVVILVVFIVQNSKPTRIDYVFFHRETRLIWIMLTCAVIGGIVGFLIGRPGKQLGRKDRQKKGDDPKK